MVGQARKREQQAPMNQMDLIDRCKTGDRDAQQELFERTSTRVYRLLLSMTGNAVDAMDLTQETYVKGLQAFSQFDGRSDIATWFYRIAVNQALQFRRWKRTTALKLRQLATTQPTQMQVSTTDTRLDLEEAMAELTPEDRAVLLLRYREECDYRRIAEVLECAEGTVASKLNRARERLREILRNSYG